MKTDTPILIDFDGVIRLGSRLAEDAPQFLRFLHDEKLPFFIITNSTRDTSEDLKHFLADSGITFRINAMTTVDATVQYLNENKLSVSVYCADSVKHRFEKFTNNKNPDAVVIGDMGNSWSYDIMNEIFTKVKNGSEIIAMQKNKFWKPDGVQFALDAGAFITAIEYASGKNSVLIGKPSSIYFHTALKLLGYNSNSPFIMIGDDLENDIYVAQQLGGKGILAYTGKTEFPLSPAAKIRPDYDAQNLSGIITILKDIL